MKFKNIALLLTAVILIWVLIEFIIAYYSLNFFTTDVEFEPSYSESSTYIRENFTKPYIAIHAIYSIDKLKKYINKYNALETDVVYSDGVLFLSHDIHIDIKASTPHLESILSYLNQYYTDNKIENEYQKTIWIDLKNIDEYNYGNIINILNTYVDKYNITRNKIIIESRNVSILPHFSKQGYLTSYYFIPSFSNNPQEDELVIKELKNNVEKYYVDFISCNVKYFRIVNKLFPNKYKNYWYDGSSIQMILRSVFVRYFIFQEDTTGILILDF